MLAKNPMAEAWTLFDIAKAAEIEVAALQERMLPTDCEIDPDKPADWYLVRTLPGDDMRALRWLAHRRFGVFRPMQQRENKRNGVKVQGMEPVFPGWLFVFVWDARKMRTRIETTPGVMKMLCYPDTDRPVPISQAFVDRLRALSWVYDANAPAAGHASVTGKRHSRRRPRLGKHARKAADAIHKLKKALKRHGKFDQSTWEQAATLAPTERIGLLERALNAPPL